MKVPGTWPRIIRNIAYSYSGVCIRWWLRAYILYKPLCCSASCSDCCGACRHQINWSSCWNVHPKEKSRANNEKVQKQILLSAEERGQFSWGGGGLRIGTAYIDANRNKGAWKKIKIKKKERKSSLHTKKKSLLYLVPIRRVVPLSWFLSQFSLRNGRRKMFP